MAQPLLRSNPENWDGFEMSGQQRQAADMVRDWLASDGPPVFRLFGSAGTGKTRLSRYLASTVNTALFASYTGKAALAMRRAGCADASTLHSIVYEPIFNKDGTVSFRLALDSPIVGADLLVIDEVSMVGEELGEDIMRLIWQGTKILVLGDPYQLPPVESGGFFTGSRPDFFLSEVHRQAKDSPIITLATKVREGEKLQYGDWGAARVIPRGVLSVEEVRQFNTVIVGRNATREVYNRRIRTSMGYSDPQPRVGEKVICLRNDRNANVLNGEIFIVTALPRSRTNHSIAMKLLSEDEPSQKPRKVAVRKEFFYGGLEDLEWRDFRNTQQLTYGYAITGHKSQGSQWSSCLVYDESHVFGEDAERWLYTAITRAQDHTTIVM